MFLFGFLGGALGVLTTPMMFWQVSFTFWKNKRLEAAYRILETRRTGGLPISGGGLDLRHNAGAFGSSYVVAQPLVTKTTTAVAAAAFVATTNGERAIAGESGVCESRQLTRHA